MINPEIPFTPSNISLREILKNKYIPKVSKWLLGKDDMSVLAQVSGSAWESALTVITLSEVINILGETNEENNLKNEISRKSILVADWLLSKKVVEGKYIHWEGVTWDTAVIIHALLIIVSKYKAELSQSKIQEIESVAVNGCKWLYYRFNQWDSDIKYPFGAADVAKLILTFSKFHEVNKKLYLELQRVYKEEVDSKDTGCWLSKIVGHLLQGRTEEVSFIEHNDQKEQVLTYWWDDYFTTAEVTEGLAVYYDFCQQQENSGSCDVKLLEDIKDSLIRSCTYFERGQVDGMWGSHIDTIKVIYSYVLIKRLVHRNHDGNDIALIEPEIHTVFKALRWMCDDKQRFSDGSFMHTMFLTVFFSAALVEVYKSWSPAKDRIDKIYDDVVWASPVRTTPERIKRLSVEIKASNLEDNIHKKNIKISKLTNIFIILVILVIILPFLVYLGFTTSGVSVAIDTSNLILTDLLTYLSIVIPIVVVIVATIWNRNSITNLFSIGKDNKE